MENATKVELIDNMGNDLSIVNAARVSFGKQKSEFEWGVDDKLIRYLAKHKHMSPFRHVMFTFRIVTSEMVMRQLYKHNVGIYWSARLPDVAWNEISGRYVEYSPSFQYLAESWREKSDKVKQGSGDLMPNKKSMKATEKYYEACGVAYKIYKELLELGVCREQARMVLPTALMTEVIMTASLEAVAHICELRLKPDAQAEIRDVALAMGHIIFRKCPIASAALLGKL